ncbi:hypothetical protein D3C76_1552560 [compost metagenome]
MAANLLYGCVCAGGIAAGAVSIVVIALLYLNSHASGIVVYAAPIPSATAHQDI